MTPDLFRRNPGFARLVAAQVPSDFADWLAFVAVAALLAYEWQAPPIAFACLGIAMGLPYVVIGPMAGALVDRWRLGAVLEWANLGRAIAVLAYVLAGSWPVLVLLVALAAAVDSFFTPAKQAALQALVAPDDRIAANGLSQGVNQVSKIAGPALGGLLLALLGPAPVFALTAAASALAAAVVAGLPLPPRPPGRTGHGIRAEIGAGLALVRESLPLRAAIGLMAAGYFAIFLYDTLIAPLIRDFALPPSVLGLCIAANGLGGVTGALAGAGLMTRGSPFAWVAGAMAAGGLCTGTMGALALAGVAPPAGVLVALFGTVGVVGAGSVVPLRTVLQNATPEGAMGRVAALSEAASTTALLIAPLAGAGLATLGGTGLPFVAGGAMALAVAVIAARLARRPT